MPTNVDPFGSLPLTPLSPSKLPNHPLTTRVNILDKQIVLETTPEFKANKGNQMDEKTIEEKTIQAITKLTQTNKPPGNVVMAAVTMTQEHLPSNTYTFEMLSYCQVIYRCTQDRHTNAL